MEESLCIAGYQRDFVVLMRGGAGKHNGVDSLGFGGGTGE